MSIGELCHRITLQMVTSSSKSSFGRRVKTKGDMGKVWGKVRTLSGRELQTAVQSQSRATHEIKIRWRENIHPHSFVVHDGKRLEIESAIDREQKKQWLYLMAIEST